MFGIKKLKQSLTKTKNTITGKLGRLVGAYQKIDDEFMEELEEILISSDIGVKASLEIVEDLRTKVHDERVKEPGRVYELLKSELLALFDAVPTGLQSLESHKPYIILVVGVNGTGKTTTIGKLGHYYKEHGKQRVLTVAADTFRAAAGAQLEKWAQRAGVDIVSSQSGADPAAVVYDALDRTLSKGYDVTIIDTAGRLHTKVNLMEELRKIDRIVKKRIPSAPHETLLVMDATTGQNGILQAKLFNEALDVTGIVLAKLDSTAKGGVVVAIKKELNIPVKFVGTGEGLEDISDFNPEEFVRDII